MYVQTFNRGETGLYGYEAKSGKLLFNSPIETSFETYSATTVFDNNVYIIGSNTDEGVYSIDADTGNFTWFFSLWPVAEWLPSVNHKYAITYSQNYLSVLDRGTGKFLINIPDPSYTHWGVSNGYAPVLIDDENVVTIQSGYITLFSIKHKNISWSQKLGFRGQPTVDDNYIYALQKNGLAVLDKNGKIVWKWSKDKDEERILDSNIIVTKNLVFLTTIDNTYAISKKTHMAVWSYPASGFLSLGKGYLFISERSSGELIAIKVD